LVIAAVEEAVVELSGHCFLIVSFVCLYPLAARRPELSVNYPLNG
jgi:hypothetical protein